LFCDHLSPVDESARNPKATSLRQAERNPFHLEHNELANYRGPLLKADPRDAIDWPRTSDEPMNYEIHHRIPSSSQ
jgi:hypothetical protein